LFGETVACGGDTVKYGCFSRCEEKGSKKSTKKTDTCHGKDFGILLAPGKMTQAPPVNAAPGAHRPGVA
jgi:hypothetical protein